jgi:hypothetical protein
MSERWLGLSLRAFPRRVRAQKTAEVTGAMAEAAEAGDTEFVNSSAFIGLVFAGWMVRWRSHPPLGRWLRYTLGIGVIDKRWHAWMLDEINGWSAERSTWARLSVWVGSIAVVRSTQGQSVPSEFVVAAIIVPLVLGRFPYFRRLRRERVLRANGFDPATRHWKAPPLPPMRRQPRLPATKALLPIGAAFSAALVVYAVWWWVPALRLEYVGGDVISTSRPIDDTTNVVGRIAVVAAMVLMVLLVAGADRFRQWLHPVQSVTHANRADPVIYTLAALVLALVPLLPVTPLALPLAMPLLLATGPMLMLLGRRARQMESGGIAVVLARPASAGSRRA